jgi:hypothetical protein
VLRPLPANIAAALQYSQLTPAFFISAEFAQGTGSVTLYAWTGQGSYTYANNTYSGIGSILTISTIESAADSSAGITARNLVVTLSGLDPILGAAAESNFMQGAALTISLALFNPAGAMLAAPVQIFGGRLDTASLTGDGKQSTISFSIENFLVDLNRSRERLLTPGDIHIEHPLDQAFSFVYDVASFVIYFRSQPAKTNNQVSSG